MFTVDEVAVKRLRRLSDTDSQQAAFPLSPGSLVKKKDLEFGPMRHHDTTARMARINKSGDNKCW